MKHVLHVYLLMVFWLPGHAQEVVATAGAASQSASGGISYTIGEIVTETFTASGTTLTQGFQQTRLVITAINEFAGLGFTIEAYPNPVTDYVKLVLRTDKVKDFRYVLYDLHGKVIDFKKIESTETIIPFLDFSYAGFVLKVFDEEREVKAFKIIKVN